jgi:superfamily II DNA helicase RecQ
MHSCAQIGRAGRDGGEAACHLCLDDADFRRLRSLNHSDQARGVCA